MKKTFKISGIEKESILEMYNILNKNRVISEGKESVNKFTLISEYDKWNTLGSEKTFDIVFENERKKKVEPFASFTNGCATKVSLALNAAGQSVPPGFMVTGGPQKGKSIQTSASGLKDVLVGKWGQPDVMVSGKINESDLLKKIGSDKTGVLICTPCGFSGASGHATIWSPFKGLSGDGGTADDTNYHLNNDSAKIYYWKVG